MLQALEASEGLSCRLPGESGWISGPEAARRIRRLAIIHGASLAAPAEEFLARAFRRPAGEARQCAIRSLRGDEVDILQWLASSTTRPAG